MTLAAGFFVVFVLGGLLGAYVHSLIRPTDRTETTPLPQRPRVPYGTRPSLTCDLCGAPIAYRTAHGLRRCATHKGVA
jgi:hypothetical protein